MASSIPTKFSVLVERAGDWWVAQCLEHDLATQVRELDALNEELLRLIEAHLACCDELVDEVPPAPAELWRRFSRARPIASPVSATLPPIEVRVADYIANP
jgi:hypothetical protein